MVLAGGRGVVRARGVREGEGNRGARRGRRRTQGRAPMVARFGELAPSSVISFNVGDCGIQEYRKIKF